MRPKQLNILLCFISYVMASTSSQYEYNIISHSNKIRARLSASMHSFCVLGERKTKLFPQGCRHNESLIASLLAL